MGKLLRATQAAVLWCILAGAAAADEVTLADGSRLVGTVEALENGVLRFATGFAGVLEIPAGQITGIETAAPLPVRLANGASLSVRLAPSPDGGLTLIHEDAGAAEIAMGDLAAIGPSANPVVPALTTEAAAATPAPGSDPEAADSNWSGRLALGLNGAQGNTNRLGFQGRANALRETDISRLDLSLAGRLTREDGDATENEVLAGIRYEQDFTPRWFAFGDLDLERDPFEDLDLRSILTTGAGYFVIKGETQKWALEAGVGYTREAFQSGGVTNNATLSLASDYSVDINNWLGFRHELTVFPEFDRPFADFRVDSRTALDIPLGDESAWQVALSLRNQYDANPAPGVEELDTTYSISLGYTFE